MSQSMIINAAFLALEAHEGQFRKYSNSDRPYIIHPMWVAGRVSLVPGASEQMVAAAWLHDVLEDTDVSAMDLAKVFPISVIRMVKDMTNPSKEHKHLSRAERKKMDREHLAQVSKEVKVIKLADRVHNMDSIVNDPLVPDKFRRLYVKESKALLEYALRGVNESLEQDPFIALDAKELIRKANV